MKKVNVVFVGECIIIALLLLLLGFLLKENKKVFAEEEKAVETRTMEEGDNGESNVWEASVSGNEISGIVNVADLVAASVDEVPAEGETGNMVVVESASTEQPSSISENMIRQGKTLFGRKIVVFGDSIWNAARGKDGISEYVQEGTGATVYNCAIGGTTAAVVGEDTSFDNWTSNSFNGMIYAARKLIPAEQILAEGEVVREVIEQVDFNETDYVIVAYGLNDFFSDVPIYPKTYYELTNYVGALRNGIDKLKEHYPHLTIIVIPPTYTKLFEGEKTFEIGNYVEAARGVAAELDVEFLDMFHVLGNNAETRTKHLGDGVHMSAEGRKVYADAVIHFLKELEAERTE